MRLQIVDNTLFIHHGADGGPMSTESFPIITNSEGLQCVEFEPWDIDLDELGINPVWRSGVAIVLLTDLIAAVR